MLMVTCKEESLHSCIQMLCSSELYTHQKRSSVLIVINDFCFVGQKHMVDNELIIL